VIPLFTGEDMVPSGGPVLRYGPRESTFPDGEVTTLPLTSTGEVIGTTLATPPRGALLLRHLRVVPLDVVLFAMGDGWLGEAVKR